MQRIKPSPNILLELTPSEAEVLVRFAEHDHPGRMHVVPGSGERLCLHAIAKKTRAQAERQRDACQRAENAVVDLRWQDGDVVIGPRVGA